MKKGILVSKRTAKDKTTGNDVLWLNIYELPREYKNKEGFPDERFAVIIENIQNVVKDGTDFLYEFLRAQGF